MYRLLSPPNSSVSPSFDSSFLFALFFLLTTFLCSKVKGFPCGKKNFSLSYTICPPSITSPTPSLAVLGHTGATSSEGLSSALTCLQVRQEGLCTPCPPCRAPILVLPFCSRRQCAGAFCLRGARGGEREKGS